MKKVPAMITVFALALSISVPAFAADSSDKLLISPSPAQTYAITVNNKSINASSKIVDGVVMVPLHSVSDALGYKIIWNNEQRSIHMENGERESDLIIGSKMYQAYSTDSLGLTAPIDLGVAPVLINNSTYVPVELFRILLGNSDEAVIIGTDAIAICDTIAAEIPNPFITYDTISDARHAAGYNFAVPTKFPSGYEQNHISVMKYGEDSLAQVYYQNGDSELMYRVSKSAGDISGDYNQYEKVETVKVGDLSIKIRQNGKLVYTATWEQGGFNYCISVQTGLSFTDLQEVILSVK